VRTWGSIGERPCGLRGAGLVESGPLPKSLIVWLLTANFSTAVDVAGASMSRGAHSGASVHLCNYAKSATHHI
jgi:hypothetical protein